MNVYPRVVVDGHRQKLLEESSPVLEPYDRLSRAIEGNSAVGPLELLRRRIARGVLRATRIGGLTLALAGGISACDAYEDTLDAKSDIESAVSASGLSQIDSELLDVSFNNFDINLDIDPQKLSLATDIFVNRAQTIGEQARDDASRFAENVGVLASGLGVFGISWAGLRSLNRKRTEEEERIDLNAAVGEASENQHIFSYSLISPFRTSRLGENDSSEILLVRNRLFAKYQTFETAGAALLGNAVRFFSAGMICAYLLNTQIVEATTEQADKALHAISPDVALDIVVPETASNWVYGRVADEISDSVVEELPNLEFLFDSFGVDLEEVLSSSIESEIVESAMDNEDNSVSILDDEPHIFTNVKNAISGMFRASPFGASYRSMESDDKRYPMVIWGAVLLASLELVTSRVILAYKGFDRGVRISRAFFDEHFAKTYNQRQESSTAR